ncbi:MAG: Ig-like domain-containing protein [Phycisphaerales bacterium JB063]
MKHRLKTQHLLAALLAPLAVCSTTLAIQPRQWSHTSEADFAGGDPYGTVVTNLGDIRLSSQTTTLDGLPEGVTHVFDTVTIGDITYVAAGPEAKILKIENGAVEVAVELDATEQVFCLAELNGMVVAGISGQVSWLGMLHEGELHNMGALRRPDLNEAGQVQHVRYVWDVMADGNDLIIATGGEAQVMRNHDADAVRRLLLANNGGQFEPPRFEVLLGGIAQPNILCLGLDADGRVYAGTDKDGLVYRIEADGTPFVLYDAPEAEIGALAVMDDGTVYAGTAAADQARPGRLVAANAQENGRPDEPDQPEAEPEVEPDPEPAPEAEEEPEAEAVPVEEGAAEPTPEDYDRLREALRERLRVARESGELAGGLDAGGGNNNPGANANNNRPSRARAAAPSGGNKPGNAIYRIDPQGFVSEVFRESAMILAIAPTPEGDLIVATGNEGQVFRVDPHLRETTVLADLDSQMVPALTLTNGGILVGGAAPASLTLLGDQLAETGQFTSQVLDAGQVSMFGTLKLTADIPPGCSVRVETRTGNVGDPALAAWSQWQVAGTLEHDAKIHALQPREIKPDNAPARYLQYRLTLTGTGTATPTVDQVDLAYVSPNMPPQVAALTVTTPAPGAPGSDHNPKLTANWQATDDNGDRVVYALEIKPAGADRYLPLAQDLTGTSYEWQTQHVPDGWYTLRVTADDRLDNPGDMAMTGRRVSDAVLVDNTPPTLGEIGVAVENRAVTLTATASDALSGIRSIGYALDGSDEYAASLPTDLIYDSTSEPWSVTISDLSPGDHVVALRIIDARGNTAYRQVIVRIEE